MKILKYLPFTSKNNCQIENSKKIMPQNGQILFDLVKGDTNFLSFCPCLAFKQSKKQILFQAQPLKM